MSVSTVQESESVGVDNNLRPSNCCHLRIAKIEDFIS
jgi:hypothetical protein